MTMTSLRRICVVLAASSLLSQAASATSVCEGKYMAAITGAKTPIQGKVNGVSNPYRKQPVNIEVKDCARTLVIHGDGAMTLSQSANNPTRYVGTQPGMVAVFDVWSPDRLTGQVMMPAASGSVIYEMTLLEGQAPNLDGCATHTMGVEESGGERLTVDPALRSEALNIVADQLDVPREKAGRYISAARTVARTDQSDEGITEIQPGEPGCPIELTDVKTCRVFPSDTTTIVEINVLLDENGRLLPVTTDGSDSMRLRVDDPGAANFCGQEATLPPADKRLRFKFLAIEEKGVNDVQTVLVDADSNHAEAAHYATGKQKGRSGRADAAAEAYKSIGAPVTGRH